MALEPKIAGEKWRRFHRDERVEPRSLIKSNWEISIRYRVYSPEKINQELQRGFRGGLWERGWEVSGGSQEGLARWGHRAPLFLPSWSQGKVSQRAEAATTQGLLGSGQWTRESAHVPGGLGRHVFISKHLAFFSILKCAWLAEHHFFPQIFPAFFVFSHLLPLYNSPHHLS